jgi:MFS family permease
MSDHDQSVEPGQRTDSGRPVPRLDVESGSRRGRGLWRQRDFLLLWGGQTVSETGANVTRLALPLTAVVVLKATTLEVGLLTAATTLAFALIALPAGAIVDRHAKRGVMVACDVARFFIIGSVPIAWYAGILTMAQLYVVALATGVGTVFFDVAYQSYLPVLVRPEHLMEGNGKLSVTQELAQLAGPGLGAGLVGAFGAAGSMTVDALSYVVSVASLLGIRHREPHRQPHSRDVTARPSLRAEISEGLRFVFAQPVQRQLAGCSGTINLASSMATAVQVIFLVHVLHVDTAYTGLVFALASLGGIAGGALSGRMARWIGSARVIWVSILVFGLPQILAPLAEPGWRVALFPVGLGVSYFAIVIYNVAAATYRQAVCPPQLMGRMAAATRWIAWGAIPFGGVLGGALGTLIGIRPTLWIAFAGSWAAGFWVYFSPLRRVRDIPRGLSIPAAPAAN